MIPRRSFIASAAALLLGAPSPARPIPQAPRGYFGQLDPEVFHWVGVSRDEYAAMFQRLESDRRFYDGEQWSESQLSVLKRRRVPELQDKLNRLYRGEIGRVDSFIIKEC
jgi:hypothetical protein